MRRANLVVGALVLATACAPPIEVRLVRPRQAQRQLTSNFHPLPFVQTVVFVSTPHRGSYIAGGWLAHQVAWLVRAPLDVTRVVTEFATFDREGLAVDNMTPGNRFVQTPFQLEHLGGL